MDNKTYRELAIKTESPIDFQLRERLVKNKNIRLLHCIMGIVSELEELKMAIQNGDRVNIGEEISDQFWYILGIGSDVLNCNFQETVPIYQTSIVAELEIITNTSSKLTDIIKKILFYGREYSMEDIKTGLYNIYCSLIQLCAMFSLDSNELKRKNIEKLAARYGDKFSEYLANNRDLSKEYEVLSA